MISKLQPQTVTNVMASTGQKLRIRESLVAVTQMNGEGGLEKADKKTAGLTTTL